MDLQERISISKNDGATTVTVVGEIDFTNASAFAEALDDAMSFGGDVIADLQRCTYMDSAGINVILAVAKRLALERHRLLLGGCSGHVTYVLGVSGCLDLVGIYDSADEALKRLGRR